MSLENLETTGLGHDVAVIDRTSSSTSTIAHSSLPDDNSLPLLFQTSKQTKIPYVLWLGVLLSAGLHIGLSLIPTGSEPPTPPKSEKAETKQIRISQLAKSNKIANLPKKVVKPASQSTIRPQNTIRQAPPIAPLKPSQPQQAPDARKETQDSSPSSSWDDFPIYPAAQAGCFGLPSCLETSDSLKQIADYYAKELPAKKYELKLAIQEPNRQVFQVSRRGESQFLSVIKTQKGHVIVLSDAPRSLEDLAQAVEVPPEVAEILSNLDARNAEPANFAKPDLFFAQSSVKPGIVNISLVKSYSYDTMMNEFFRSNLQNAGFEVTDLPQTYGDGKLYQISKGTLKLYLNLVPSTDSAIVVTWKDLPQ